MTHEEYKIESERTLSPSFFIDDEVQKLLHGAIGIVTELGELSLALDNNDVVNIGEEMADIMWYVAIFDRHYGIARFTDVEFVTIDEKFFRTATELLDGLKKKVFYDRPLNDMLVIKQVNFIQSNIDALCNNYNLDVDVLRAQNIAKLRSRFPEKFTTELANNRNLEAERTILEANV